MKQHIRRILVTGTAMVGFTSMSHAQVYIAHTLAQPPVLVADAGADQTSCAGAGLSIGGNPSAIGGQAGYTYNWQPPTGLSDPTIANPVASPTGTQAYTLTVVDANGCTSSDQVNVTLSNVVANYSVSTNLLTASFSNASTGATSYLWDFGDLLSSTFANPSHTYASPGTYMTCLTINLGTPCQDSLCLPVTVVAVGLDAGMTGRLIVYPNPVAEGDIHFALTGITLSEPVEIRLYDAAGRLVRNYTQALPPKKFTKSAAVTSQMVAIPSACAAVKRSFLKEKSSLSKFFLLILKRLATMTANFAESACHESKAPYLCIVLNKTVR